ncbi:hypothetical protein HQQ82_00205 [Rathayibacter sp. VKM Ac-2856]|uniref:hypothetical protein n=1 Tax=unclassified Rathayibacter TaxID=2609250 RepID=UPI001564658A|nr:MULTISPECIES: hypothetical protein [unclassified Rathayibacter]NQX03216.1 hypothetical protein [Rathayibacter sp. VKM Ac-2858]NQX18384.1 hypothetical protein [Rathayibacter sp. VKM Ac-2856]
MSAFPDYTWLPEHHEQVVYTLAHVDSIIEQLATILFDFQEGGVFDFVNGTRGQYSYAVIAGVHPLPPAVPRLFADGATQLRAAIEHTLFAQVEYELGTTLDEAGLDARRIEMPASVQAADFAAWLDNGARRKIRPLQNGQELVSRIRRLQPYWHVDPLTHPMKLLAEHTNRAKHRAPSTAVTRVGPVHVEGDSRGVELAPPPPAGTPARVGDVIARSAAGIQVPIAIYPDISVRRPHNGQWRVLIHELNDMFDWVRREALPILITGMSGVTSLPGTIDISVGHENAQAALQTARSLSSFERGSLRLQARGARENLVDVLAAPRSSASREIVGRWLAHLTDADVVAVVHEVGDPARSGDPASMLRAVADVASRATAWSKEQPTGTTAPRPAEGTDPSTI